jgi:hypothetical protein
MDVSKLDDMKMGWFIGNFDPAVLKTDQFEVALHRHKAGCETHTHYHKKSTEYNLIVVGKMVVNGKTFVKNDIFVINPYEVSETQFLEDTMLVVVKTPSAPNDKYSCES